MFLLHKILSPKYPKCQSPNCNDHFARRSTSQGLQQKAQGRGQAADPKKETESLSVVTTCDAQGKITWL